MPPKQTVVSELGYLFESEVSRWLGLEGLSLLSHQLGYAFKKYFLLN